MQISPANVAMVVVVRISEMNYKNKLGPLRSPVRVARIFLRERLRCDIFIIKVSILSDMSSVGFSKIWF